MCKLHTKSFKLNTLVNAVERSQAIVINLSYIDNVEILDMFDVVKVPNSLSIICILYVIIPLFLMLIVKILLHAHKQ